jgi:AbrB family looped-hinge helix DNA binding protein
MIRSRISPKGQITLPKTVREAIGAGPGDTVVYEIEGGAVRLRRVDPFDVEFHEALGRTLDEWTSAEDEAAFRDL